MKRSYTAEFLGTFQLVFIGTGSVLLVETQQWSYPQLWIGLAFGFAVFLGIMLFGKTSGAHMNPAVSIALSIRGDFDKKELPFYLIFQFVGAIVASACLATIYPDHPHYGDTLPRIGNWQSFALEFGLTFVLMLGVIFDFHSKSSIWQAGILIGEIVGLEAYFAGPYCGASMNPARSLSPAVFSGMWSHIWIYLIATTLGAVGAVLLFKRSK
ncbi:MAG: aquaporin [Fluviicola sp. XM-24bin1]|nr:MAG: aquaporin [Fluviicola sp. XM-24bin1]